MLLLGVALSHSWNICLPLLLSVGEDTEEAGDLTEREEMVELVDPDDKCGTRSEEGMVVGLPASKGLANIAAAAGWPARCL